MAEPDLTVDYDFLAESERKLGRLHRMFKDIENRRDDMHGHWGSDAVADVMVDFVDNWDDYRTKLIESIESVGKLVAGTKKAFEDLDDELSKRDEKKPKK
ncbi:hypothetical protein BKI49_20930 [Streptomyces sp. Tue6028]|uniref:hypothetical protein n=1 Tax=Streptomyces sp. Tue6028 TaxID=2036037 RepID=UPI000BB386AA|nr:hypothetical protein [Streptomyces sp. Tue6028]PBC62052.1 hypothetical protein BKI49_20930 [Streptomyces sp. Tue6028]